MRRARVVAIGSALLLGLIPGRSVGDGESEIEGTGDAAVIGGNVVSARRRALANAAADAVTRAIAGRIGGEPSNLRPIQERAGHYLRRYRVLEERQDGSRFLVRVAAVVDEPRLRRDLAKLGLTIAAAGKSAVPRILVQVSGQDATLAAALRRALEVALSREGLAPEPGSCVADACCVEAAVALAGRDAVRGPALPLAQVRLSLALRVGGAQVVAKREEGWGWGEGGAAAALALERALPATLSPVLDELRRRHPRPPRAVRVSPVSTLTQLLALERAPGLAPAWLEEAAGGEVALSVAAGDGRSLSALEKLALPGFSLTISKIEGGTLWLDLRPAQAPPAP